MGNNLHSCSRGKNSGGCAGMKWSMKAATAPIEQENCSLLAGPTLIAACSSHSSSTEEAVADSEIDLELALDQIFLLCESGAASTIDFILSSHPTLLKMLNSQRYCVIADITMQLTPLQLAVACGNTSAIRALLMLSVVQPNICDPYFGMTALHLAVTLCQLLSLEELCRDARVTYENKTAEGKTALHLAVELEYANAVDTVLRLHPTVDLGIRDDEGNNIFHTAAKHPNTSIMSKLVSHASLVYLYVDSFDSSLCRARDQVRKSTRKQSRPIFEALNHHNETPRTILTDALRNVQSHVINYSTTVLGKSHAKYNGDDDNSSPVFNERLKTDTLVMSDEPLTTGEISRFSSETTSPLVDDYTALVGDTDTLLQCIEILTNAENLTCLSPARSMSTFRLRGEPSSHRQRSFDLESLASEDGSYDSADEGNRTRTKWESIRECKTLEENAAYSWSPPFTPSLDPPELQNAWGPGKSCRS